MKILKQIGISLIISILVVSGANFLNSGDTGLGAITIILGTDKLSDSRVTINDNFTDLDTTKMEISTTTLPLLTTLTNLITVGTIGTGTWNADVLTVSYGGTGLSTLTANAVMLGNGTSNVAFVSGLGSSGQFLTSQGAGADPQWTTGSIDQGLDYNFTGSIFNVKNLFASSTVANPITLNTVAYAFPSSDGVSGTVLTTNGSGALTWNSVSASTTTYTSSGTYNKSTGVKIVFVQAWAGGGSGENDDGTGGAGGGGGGEYIEKWIIASDVGATETVTVGSGGAAVSSVGNGNGGGVSTFGSLLTAHGGSGGSDSGTDGNGGNGGSPLGNIEFIWGGSGGTGAGKTGSHSAGGGGGLNNSTTAVGGNSIDGGAGGGGASGGSSSGGGTSTFGGNGGAGSNSATATSGTVPSGGGGANAGNIGDSGAGADGQMIITEFF